MQCLPTPSRLHPCPFFALCPCSVIGLGLQVCRLQNYCLLAQCTYLWSSCCGLPVSGVCYGVHAGWHPPPQGMIRNPLLEGFCFHFYFQRCSLKRIRVCLGLNTCNLFYMLPQLNLLIQGSVCISMECMDLTNSVFVRTEFGAHGSCSWLHM